MYVGNQQVYLKNENGKYYIVDKNGEYVLKEDGSKRPVNTTNISNMSNIDYANVKNKENTSISTSLNNKNIGGMQTNGKIELQNGVYSIDGRQVRLSEKDKDSQGRYYLIDENGNYVKNSNGRFRVINPNNVNDVTRENLENYAKYGYTYGNAKPLFDRMTSAGYDLSDLKQNISRIDGTTITLTSGKTFDINNMSNNQIYDAVKSGGTTLNPDYNSNSSGYNSILRSNNYDAASIKYKEIKTGSGTSSGLWTNQTRYTIVDGTGDHYASDHCLSEKEANLLMYICAHEAGAKHSPAQDSAIASAILNGWESQINGSTPMTFSEYVARSCVKYCNESSIRNKSADVASGNYNVYDGTWTINNGNDTRRIDSQMVSTVSTVLEDGVRTTDATQWVAGGDGYNRFTHGDWNKKF